MEKSLQTSERSAETLINAYFFYIANNLAR